MPIYEYQCAKCRRMTSVLTTRVGEKATAACGHCGSKKLHRLMSRFAMPKSEQARLDRMSDPSSYGGFDENDPKSVARTMRKMGTELGGDEFSGPDFDEAVEAIESGGESDGDDSDNGGL
ncbi:MAG: FmdB family zinc ribbon protein [Candidatus Binataceae bacterium]